MSVCQRSQTAGRNSCSFVSGNVSNCSHRLTVLSCHEFASQFGLAFFIREQLPKSLGNRVASASVYFNESPIGHCLASVGKGAPNHDGVIVGRTETANSDSRVWGVRVRECARVCASVRECARVCASVRECARVCASLRECARAYVRA